MSAFRVEGLVAYYRLANGEDAIIDAADVSLVGMYRWHAQPMPNGTYVQAKDGRRTLYIHRLVMGLERGDLIQVDHINHNPLDNRRTNLRVVTNAENAKNRGIHSLNQSGIRGVSRFVSSTGIEYWVGKVAVELKCESEAHAVATAAELRRLMQCPPGRGTGVGQRGGNWVGKASRTGYFPYTIDGLHDAGRWVEAARTAVERRELVPEPKGATRDAMLEARAEAARQPRGPYNWTKKGGPPKGSKRIKDPITGKFHWERPA